MSDLPPPSDGLPPPPPGAMPPPPQLAGLGDTVPGGVRYRVLPFVIPLTAAMVAHLVTKVIVIARSGTQVDDAKAFLDGTITEAVYEDRVGATSGIAAVSSLAQTVVGVLSIIVLFRILANHRAKQLQTAWAPPWAIFGWVLPPVLAVIPTLLLSEAWKASSGRGAWRQERTNPLIWAWAVAYIAGGVIGAIAGFQLVSTVFDLGDLATESNTRDAAQAMVDSITAQNVSDGVLIVAGVLWVLVVRQLTDRHARNITGELR